MLLRSCSVLWVLWVVACYASRPTLDTTSGQLIGKKVSVGGETVHQFLGVPYAQPPVGDKRFKLPQLIERSMGQVDASSHQDACMQPPHLESVVYPELRQEDIDFSEDCLYLNIYIPETSNVEPKGLPVLVWLPGEGFDFGIAGQYDGSKLAASGDVIVITVQYRLSVFGFLTTGDDAAPANLALHDIHTALQWIRNNKKSLGADAQKITLMGRLTGAGLASAFITSPLRISKRNQEPLVNGLILQSTIAHGPWMIESEPESQTQMLADIFGVASSNSEEMISDLQSIPAEDLLREAQKLAKPFRLTISEDSLPVAPLHAGQKAANMPILIGHNTDEGALCLLNHFAMETTYWDRLQNNTLDSDDLERLVYIQVAEYFRQTNRAVAQEAANRYQCEKSDDSSCRVQFVKFCSDMYSRGAISVFSKIQARHGNPVFKYQFSHRPRFSLYPSWVSAAPSDEVLFVFGHLPDSASPLEKRLSTVMMSAWTNFAKFGNPNPLAGVEHWPQHKNGEVLIFKAKSPGVVNVSEDNNVRYWERSIMNV